MSCADSFGAPGDFAQAYVIAHEFGHHVQTLLGTEERVQRERSSTRARRTSCRSGWSCRPTATRACGRTTRTSEELLSPATSTRRCAAAAAVGDDRIQRAAGQRVNPETWTHGSAAQRSQWLRTGFSSGDPRSCDTFSASI